MIYIYIVKQAEDRQDKRYIYIIYKDEKYKKLYRKIYMERDRNYHSFNKQIDIQIDN